LDQMKNDVHGARSLFIAHALGQRELRCTQVMARFTRTGGRLKVLGQNRPKNRRRSPQIWRTFPVPDTPARRDAGRHGADSINFIER
jgi:hypothetical protein